MDNIIGPPVTGKNLLFRDKEIDDILRLLGAGNSVLVIGLRRIGKSSVMQGVCERAPEGWFTSYHNLETIKHPANLFSVLLRSLPRNKRNQVVSFLVSSKKLSPKGL